MLTSITKEMVFTALAPRRADSHKGTYGKVLAVCGCPRYRGAAALCVMGALRAGAGIVTLAAEETVITSMAARVPEAVFLPDADNDALAGAAAQATVCVAGCGCEENEDTAARMRLLLRSARGAFVLDAGGLCSLAGDTQALAGFGGGLILTPHPGEMAKLAGIPTPQVLQMPADVALGYARKTGAVVVLKSHRTLVATPAGRLYANTTGNPGLARGGSGDVLAGIIAGLAAQGLSPVQAAVCGVWLHGAAADACAELFSVQGMLPEDLAVGLGAVFLENGR